VHIGDRLVTAEVIAEDAESGFLTLLVREDRILEDKTAKKTHPAAEEGRKDQAQASDAGERAAGAAAVERREGAAALTAEQEESATIKQSPQEKG